jgi:hypothetical protein
VVDIHQRQAGEAAARRDAQAPLSLPRALDGLPRDVGLAVAGDHATVVDRDRPLAQAAPGRTRAPTMHAVRPDA